MVWALWQEIYAACQDKCKIIFLGGVFWAYRRKCLLKCPSSSRKSRGKASEGCEVWVLLEENIRYAPNILCGKPVSVEKLGILDGNISYTPNP